MDSRTILIMAKNVDVCVGRTKGIQEQMLQLGFEGFRHLNVFENPVSHLLWRKHLLQLMNPLLQRNTPSPSMNPACLSSNKKRFQNTFLNSLSFRKALCGPSFFRSVWGKQKKVLCKLNYSWLENIMRFDPISTGLQVSCRYTFLDKSHSIHHYTAW